MNTAQQDTYLIPVQDTFLLYAPLHQLSAVIDSRAAGMIRAGLSNGSVSAVLAVQTLVDRLRAAPAEAPSLPAGSTPHPLFLGLIPTRGCNMACVYCDFAAPKQTERIMDFATARAAIDAYLALLVDKGMGHAEIHFFGGEPFAAPELVHFAVGYASARAAQHGLSVAFEATTNGLYSAERCAWIANHFNTIVLSLDGPPDIHNRHRPAINGRGTFDVVARSAAILSAHDVTLVIRLCVTDETADRMPEMARWIAESFQPRYVCMETLTRSPYSCAAGLDPPDPWAFGRAFEQARRILDQHGIELILATAETRQNRLSFCPVGQDALIVSPDATVNGCYLLPETWAARGHDMVLGMLDTTQPRFALPVENLARLRRYSVDNRTLCANCFCRYHCAGGCHVYHDTTGPAGAYDSLCVQTRIVTAAKLLAALGEEERAARWFADDASLRHAILQPDDRVLSEVPK